MDALLCKSPHNRRFQNAHVFQNRRPNLKIAKRTRAVSIGKKMFGVCSKIGEGGTHPQVKWQQKLHAKQGFVCCFNMQDPLQSHAVDTATPSTNQADLHFASILIPCALLKLIKKNGRAKQVACGVESERDTDLTVGRGGLGKATRHRRRDGMRWRRRG